MSEEMQENQISQSAIQKKYQRGMTVEQLSILYGLNTEYIELLVKGVRQTPRKFAKEESSRINVKPKVKKNVFMRPKKPINYDRVEKLIDTGFNLKQISEIISFNYSTFCGRLADERPDLSQKAAHQQHRSTS